MRDLGTGTLMTVRCIAATRGSGTMLHFLISRPPLRALASMCRYYLQADLSCRSFGSRRSRRRRTRRSHARPCPRNGEALRVPRRFSKRRLSHTQTLSKRCSSMSSESDRAPIPRIKSGETRAKPGRGGAGSRRRNEKKKKGRGGSRG